MRGCSKSLSLVLVVASSVFASSGCQSGNTQQQVTVAEVAEPRSESAEKAARAFHALYPDAVLEEVINPENIRRYPEPRAWLCYYRIGDQRKDVLISPDGFVTYKRDKISPSELPPPVARAIDEHRNDAPTELEKLEIYADQEYVPITTRVRYGVWVEKDDERFYASVSPDGIVEETSQLGKRRGKQEARPVAAKEADIPVGAVGAVQAIKQRFPGGTVQTIWDDSGTNERGQERNNFLRVVYLLDTQRMEIVAKPDGTLCEVYTWLSVTDLPDAARTAVLKEWPDGTISSAMKSEEHAEVKYVQLPEARVTYIAKFYPSKGYPQMRFGPDGTKFDLN